MNSRIAINLVFFFNGFLFVSWAARMPRVQGLFSLEYDQLGFVLLASSIGSVVAMPFAGYLIQRHGSRLITMFSAFSFYLAVPLFSWMPSYISLIVAFFYMGASVGIMDVSMNGQAVEVEKRFGKPIMSFFHAMFSTGMMVGAASVSGIEALQIDLWLHLLIVSVVAAIVMLFVIPHLVDEADIVEERAQGPKFRLPTGPLVILGLIAFCCMLGEGAMAEWATNYMLEVSLATEVIAPLGLFSFSAAMTLGRLFGDRARQAWGDTNLVQWGGIISSLGLGLVIGIPNPYVTIVGLFVVGIGLATIVPIVYSLAGNMPGVKPGVGISMATTIGYSGFLFGPPIIGLLADSYGLRWAWLFVLTLFTAMFFLVLLRPKGQH